MKRTMLSAICFTLTLILGCTAFGESLRDDEHTRIRGDISISGYSVTVNIRSTTSSGYSLSVTAVIQENNGFSWYNATSQASGIGSVRISCTGTSGYSYRGYYTYTLRDASGNVVTTGSGYTGTKQIP